MSQQQDRALAHGFPPLAREDAVILILGSLPGRASLEKQQYYAQPRNSFWRIMEQICGAGPALEYDARLAALQNAGIALWDVLAAAERPGSLDSAIVPMTAQFNDFGELFARCTELRAVHFNGRKAAELFERHVVPSLSRCAGQLVRTCLPSTSPAYASIGFDDKLRHWKQILEPQLSGGSSR
jgi:TDG/mug DNA glycosylase family protein